MACHRAVGRTFGGEWIRSWALCVLIGLIAGQVCPAQTISTVAGREPEEGEPAGRVGDGGPATEALLSDPFGVCMDDAGNLYIADTSGQRIRRVDPSGTITTVAGDGRYGFSGDGGRAVDAGLSNPTGCCVDGSGNLYIADTFNHRIRRVDASGTIATVAGNGTAGFSGDGGPASEAQLAGPFGVFVDGAGVLTIADRNNHRVRQVDISGTITTVAGNGDAGLSGDGGPAVHARLSIPSGVCVDRWGSVYIADSGNNRIRRVDPSGGITTVAGGGGAGFSGDGEAAVSASLNGPFGLFVDGSGALLIADTDNHRIRRVGPALRTLRIRADSGSISADGADVATIQVTVLDLSGENPVDGIPVSFRVLRGEGVLSDAGRTPIGGRAEIRLTSRTPGHVAVQASAAGAWGVTASVEVLPVLALAISAEPAAIPANGYDAAVLDVRLLDLEGHPLVGDDTTRVGFRIVAGEGGLSEREVPAKGGRASAGLIGLAPGRVTVQAGSAGARPVSISVAVVEPAPGQLPDAYEPDGEMALAREISPAGAAQVRTVHTRGDTDWAFFDAKPGYAYAVAATGELDVRLEVYGADGGLLGSGRDGVEIVFSEEQGGRAYVAASGADGGVGRYALSATSRRAAALSLSAVPDTIAADGSDASAVRVQILGEDGRLLDRDDTTRVALEVVAGDGVLSSGEVTVEGGTAEVVLTVRAPGRATVAAVAMGVPRAIASVAATPALALDLHPAPGDQGLRESASAPQAGDRVSVELAAVSGAGGILGFQVTLKYDTDRLAFVGFEGADLMADGATIPSFPGEGEVEINTVLLRGGVVRDSGSLGSVTFRVREGFTGGATVMLASAVYATPSAQQRLRIGAGSASVSIGGEGGGAETPSVDLLQRLRDAFGKRAGEPGYSPALDLDGDGRIGFSDFLIFMQGLGER